MSTATLIKKTTLEKHSFVISLFEVFKDKFVHKKPMDFNTGELGVGCIQKIPTEEISGLPPIPVPDPEDGYVDDTIGVEIEKISSFIPFEHLNKMYFFQGTIWFQRFENELHLIKGQGNISVKSQVLH